jgi:hypothetical protein
MIKVTQRAPTQLIKLSRRYKKSTFERLINEFNVKREQSNDFNVQYGKLDKRKGKILPNLSFISYLMACNFVIVRITFRDIFRDYKNFRNAYYYHPKITTYDEKEEVNIDPKSYSLLNTLNWYRTGVDKTRKDPRPDTIHKLVDFLKFLNL